MSHESSSSPWSYDELQLIGAELGDTIEMVNEDEVTKIGVVIFLTKSTVFVLTEKKEIIKFNRNSLISNDGVWDIIGLSSKNIKLSKKDWQDAKKQIETIQKRKKKNENIL